MAHTLILARHGETAANPRMGNPGALRGQSDIPLDGTGILQAYRMGSFFRDKPVAAVESDGLQRNQFTASEIARPHGIKVQTSSDIGPWNMGNLVGMPTDTGTAELQRLSSQAPDEPAGQIGESFHAFAARWGRGFGRLQSVAKSHHGITVAVTHGRNIQTAKAHVSGDKRFLKWGHSETPPGGLALFHHTGLPGATWKMVPGDPLAKTDTSLGE